MLKAPSYRSTIAALAIGQIVSWAAMFYTFSSFVLPMQRTLGWSKPELMGAFTLALVMWGVGSYSVGVAIDRGHGRAVMTGGSVLGALGFAMWSQATSLALLYAAWGVIGIAMAMTLYEPVFAIVTRRYPTRYMSGITTLTLVGGFASTLSFPATVGLIAWLDWRGALLFMAAVLLLVVAPLHAWALRDAPEAARTDPVEELSQDHATLGAALRGPTFWLLTATFTLYNFASSALWVHLMPALASKGLSEAQALAVVVWFGPAQVFGRLVYFRFGKGLSPRGLGLAIIGAMPLSLALFALVDQRLGLLLFALMFGLINGLVTIYRGGVVPDYFGRTHVGRISGAMATISLIIRASAPVVTAWMLVDFGSYRGLLLAMAAIGATAFVSLMFAGRPRRRPVVAVSATPGV